MLEEVGHGTAPAEPMEEWPGLELGQVEQERQCEKGGPQPGSSEEGGGCENEINGNRQEIHCVV